MQYTIQAELLVKKIISKTTISFLQTRQTFWHDHARHQALRLTGIFYHTHTINILQRALPCFFALILVTWLHSFHPTDCGWEHYPRRLLSVVLLCLNKETWFEIHIVPSLVSVTVDMGNKSLPAFMALANLYPSNI